MQNTVTQIPLDFGGEPEVPPPPSVEVNGTADHRGKQQYMAAAGVGVRVKSYKQPATPAAANAELFPVREPEEPQAAVAEPLIMEAEPLVAEADAVAGPLVAEVEAMPLVEEEEPLVEVAAEPAVEVAAGPLAVEEAEAKTSRAKAPPSKTPPAKKGPSKRGRKSLKQVSAEADLIEIPADEVLFSKQYYTMGEVAEMFRVNQSLLRYWETEFDALQPRKNKKGDRYFRPVDIKTLHLIYHLLRRSKYTIEGAKEFLRKNKKAKERFEVIEKLQQIKSFLLEWKAQL
jgi:DNA-binding transcriptional MerR regulator